MENSFMLGTNSIQTAGYDLMDHVQSKILSGNVKEGMDYLLMGMRKMREKFGANPWQEFSENSLLQHPIIKLTHECPITYHSFHKPRGYAGDAELLDYIYGFKPIPPNVSVVGKEIAEYALNIQFTHSVRKRLSVFAQKIDAVASEVSHPKILSIACGHLREEKKSLAIQEGNIGKLIAFDQDPLSLAQINSELDKDFIETIQGSVTQLIRENQKFENLDLIYVSGLYDYLSQPFAMRLTTMIFRMLKSGGKLLLANLVPDCFPIDYMETFMQWQLIYRTEKQLENVANEIPTSEIADKHIFAEDNGNIVFLELTKA